MNARRTALQNWLHTLVPDRPPPHLEALTGDASFRRFYRLPGWHPDHAPRDLIAVDAPPATENNTQYLAIGEAWHRLGLPVPEICAADLANGFFLIEDLGTRQFADAVDPAVAASREPTPFYHAALDLLQEIQRLAPDARYPRYERDRLMTELELFPTWLVDAFLGLGPPTAEHNPVAQAFPALADYIDALPRCCVHRDWHSRNLLITTRAPSAGSPHPSAPPALGIVDFQDALWGPYIYDVVSLLRDCYISWPEETVRRWLAHYVAHAPTPFATRPHLQQDFDFTGIQRQLKACGIFARLYERDGRTAYLKDVPAVLGQVISVSQRYPMLVPLAEWLQRDILPATIARLDQLGLGYRRSPS